MQESYTYDAEGSRVTRTRNGMTTIYLSGLVVEEGRTIRRHYAFGGQVVAQRSRTNGQDTVIYLHGDHLGSIAVTTDAAGNVRSSQDYTPWGDVRKRAGGVQTAYDYTGQRRDGNNLIYLHARYYDPTLGRFISADSIVPGTNGNIVGVGDGKLTPLTVDFHEPGFASTVGEENGLVLSKGFGDEETVHVGPGNPQALNRYSYVLNNPLRYTDPTGHRDSEEPDSGIGIGCDFGCIDPTMMAGTVAGGGGGGRSGTPPRGKAGPPKTPPKSGARIYKNGVRVPRSGAGGNGTASEFGSLNGWSRAEADAYLRSLGPVRVHTTGGGYTHYKYADGSEVFIRPDGRVGRIPAPRYEPDGRRIRGERLDQNGNLTADHDIGGKYERVTD